MIIGKANTMYTLWSEGHKLIGNRMYDTYEYVRNISKDINKVRKLYPDLKIDESLRGHYVRRASCEYAYIPEKKKPVNPEKFSFGKYAGMLISECKDADYLVWYYDAIYHKPEDPLEADGYAEMIKNVAEQAKKFDYYPWGEFLVDKEVYDHHINAPKELKKAKNEIKKNHAVVICPENNIDYHSLELYGEFHGVRTYIKFDSDQVVVNNYRGYEYLLPTIKGKGKRIKGKDLKIYVDNVKFENEDRPEIASIEAHCVSFEILK